MHRFRVLFSLERFISVFIDHLIKVRANTDGGIKIGNSQIVLTFGKVGETPLAVVSSKIRVNVNG